MTQETLNTDESNAMLEKLRTLGYRFTRPLVPRSVFNGSFQTKLLKAIIIDTETTGLDVIQDKIIELGMLAFEYCPETGQIGKIIGSFNELEDPGKPIPAESNKVHGITDEMVSGKKIIDTEVEAFIADSSLIIAHNAGFDRKLVEARFPMFTKKAWACSANEIPWSENGFGSRGLEFLAYKLGFHYEGHRAINDCEALLELLHAAQLNDGLNPLLQLLQSARTKGINVSALNSPFDSKDCLKARKYRWNPDKKLWTGTVLLSELEAEKDWLRANVYDNRAFSIEVERVDAFIRFSNRVGVIEVVKC